MFIFGKPRILGTNLGGPGIKGNKIICAGKKMRTFVHSLRKFGPFLSFFFWHSLNKQVLDESAGVTKRALASYIDATFS